MTTGRDKNGRFLPGNTFCKGRAAGVRRRLHNEFIEALCTDFHEHGMEAVTKARKRSPVQYLKVCVSLFPRDVNVTIDAVSGLADHAGAQLLPNLPQGRGGLEHAELRAQGGP